MGSAERERPLVKRAIRPSCFRQAVRSLEPRLIGAPAVPGRGFNLFKALQQVLRATERLRVEVLSADPRDQRFSSASTYARYFVKLLARSHLRARTTPSKVMA